jgi:hypothetical protein
LSARLDVLEAKQDPLVLDHNRRALA